MDPFGQHLLEAFPLILSLVVMVSLYKNFFMVKLSTAVLILLTTCLYMGIQLSWWFLHFYQGVVVMPGILHTLWTVADTMIMVTFIQIMSGRE